MNRRTLLKAIAGLGIAAGTGIGTWEVGEYLARAKFIRERHVRCEAELKELEKLALETHIGTDIQETTKNSTNLSGFFGYEHSFQMAIGNNFSYQKYLSNLKEKKFPYDKYLIVADIGGSYGTAAAELQRIKGVEAFVIDPFGMGPIKGWPGRVKGLPANRFIIKKIEETGLPDESFHFMTSYNSHQYMDVPKSFAEPYRLLKKGGSTIFEIQQAFEPEYLEKLNSLPFRNDIYVAFGAIIGKAKMVSLPEFVEGTKKIRKEMGKDGETGLMMLLVNNAFIINKK